MIRVLRLIEYVYDSHDLAEADMGNWSMPQNGSRSFRGPLGEITIRSAVLPETTLVPVALQEVPE